MLVDNSKQLSCDNSLSVPSEEEYPNTLVSPPSLPLRVTVKFPELSGLTPTPRMASEASEEAANMKSKNSGDIMTVVPVKIDCKNKLV